MMNVNMVCVHLQDLPGFGEEFTFKQDHIPFSEVSLQAVFSTDSLRSRSFREKLPNAGPGGSYNFGW